LALELYVHIHHVFMTDMLRQMADLPSMEALVQMPIPLSYYIASKLPLQDCTRQELLETEGTVNRLKREIQLLEGMDKLKCNRCRELIARRSDMLVMSSDGPISAYVNAHGYVHETLTLSNAYGLFEDGDAQTENSWFPGYAFSLSFSAFSMPSQLWCISFNSTSMCTWFYDASYCLYPSLVSLFHMSNFRKASGCWLMGTDLLHGYQWAWSTSYLCKLACTLTL
jgi:hypothetical protein